MRDGFGMQLQYEGRNLSRLQWVVLVLIALSMSKHGRIFLSVLMAATIALWGYLIYDAGVKAIAPIAIGILLTAAGFIIAGLVRKARGE